jgi:hypothetical protein
MPRRYCQVHCDLFGRPQHAAYFGLGTPVRRRFSPFQFTEFPPDLAPHAFGGFAPSTENEEEEPDVQAVASRLREHPTLASERAKLTPKQRRVVDAAIFNNRSLHDFAREEGTTVQALGYRIKGLSQKAPVLYALWVFRNRDRYDISEVLNAIRRAIDSVSAKPPDPSA